MLNPATEAIYRDEAKSDSKFPLSKPDITLSPQCGNNTGGGGGMDGTMKKTKSPKVNRRVLPDAPMFLKVRNSGGGGLKENLSKSSEDLLAHVDKKEDEKNKFKYNSLPRKKNKQQRTMSTSTFYIDSTDGSQISHFDKSDSASNSRHASPQVSKKRVSRNSAVLHEEEKALTSTSNSSNISNNNEEKQTHIALYKFYGRHKDELSFVDGDPIQVIKYFDDLWYEGINLSTGKQGVFPCRYVADIMSTDAINTTSEEEHEHKQFHMRFLGSVEVNSHKGDEILCFAIAKVVNQRSMLSTSNPPSCVLQVSPRGIRICDLIDNIQTSQDIDRKPKKGKPIEKPANEDADAGVAHFFSLKNVTFCGNHPKDRRYFGFITKHPDEHRFACHIFMSKFSTDHVARIIGECFQRFYANYLEYRAPTEDLYIE